MNSEDPESTSAGIPRFEAPPMTPPSSGPLWLRLTSTPVPDQPIEYTLVNQSAVSVL